MRKLFTIALALMLSLSMGAQHSVKRLYEGGKYSPEGKIVKLHNVNNIRASIFSEDFSSGSLPAGWQNIDNGTTGFVWYFDNPGGRTINTTTASNGFAIFDSDYNGGGSEDADLITPPIDCSGNATVKLRFEHYFRSGYGGAAEVSVSGDNGATWTSLEAWSANSTDNASVAEYDITSVAAGQSQVLIKWNWTGDYSWYWAVDDVSVYEPEPNNLGVINMVKIYEHGTDTAPVIDIKNAGTDAQDDFSVRLIINDGTSDVYDETQTLTGAGFAPGDTLSVSMPVWSGFADGNYTATAIVNLAGDLDNTNDTLVSDLFAGILMGYFSDSVSYNTCNAILTDNGGLSGDYSGPDTCFVTLFPDGGDYVRLNFTEFEISAYSAELSVYDGQDENAALIGTWNGSDSPGEITATNADGALSIKFAVSSTYQYPGFTAEVSCYTPLPHDLAVTGITPSVAFSGNSITPKITVHNEGLNDESSFTVELTDGNSYTSTVNVSGTLAAGADTIISMDEWTPEAGDYSLTATVTVTDDGNNSNDTLSGFVFKCLDINKTAYAYYIWGEGDPNPAGVVAFDYEHPETFFQLSEGNGDIFAGELIDGIYYAATYNNTTGAADFVTINMETGERTVIASGITHTFYDFAYDYSSSALYGVYLTSATEYEISTINLTDGTITAVGTGTGTPMTIACDLDGNLYAIDTNGDFLSVDKTDGTLSSVGATGVTDIKYIQSMAFDHKTGNLYWAQQGETDYGKFYSIDKTSGTATLINTMEDNAELVGLAFYYDDNISVDEVISRNIKVSPNPSNGVFNINVDNDYRLEVFDITGRVIDTRNLTGNTTLELDNAGIYFLRFSDDEGSFTKKVIIQ